VSHAKRQASQGKAKKEAQWNSKVRPPHAVAASAAAAADGAAPTTETTNTTRF